jgi:hypothetical protein
MQKWEYLFVSTDKSDENHLNFYGAQGWELVAFDSYNLRFIFKRAIH